MRKVTHFDTSSSAPIKEGEFKTSVFLLSPISDRRRAGDEVKNKSKKLNLSLSISFLPTFCKSDLRKTLSSPY
jgi:hypothetical protein